MVRRGCHESDVVRLRTIGFVLALVAMCLVFVWSLVALSLIFAGR